MEEERKGPDVGFSWEARMILKGLKKRLGSKNAVKSSRIETVLQLRGSQVRDAVRDLRRAGHLIGSISRRSSREGGYFLCETSEEYEDTRKHMANRVESLTRTIRAMDNAAARELGFQSELPLPRE